MFIHGVEYIIVLGCSSLVGHRMDLKVFRSQWSVNKICLTELYSFQCKMLSVIALVINLDA